MLFLKASEESQDSIAVIGMSGQFPGARNIDEFWQNLKAGKESIKHFTDAELLAAGIDKSILNQPNYIKARGVLDDPAMFDAKFFGYSSFEADITDPQQRLFITHAWQALELAGYTPGKYDGTIGVYAGMSDSTYLQTTGENIDSLSQYDSYQHAIATSNHFLATKVSYALNLTGPSLSINTACSTSLVAIINACKSLLIYDCDMSLAGGVSISFPQEAGYFYQEGHILSSDGHCRALDAAADGTVNGSGVGVVVLKRLTDAIEEGDNVLAIIRGFAVNNDGAAKVGYTAPSMLAESGCISSAMAYANASAEDISYVEVHGTGTPIGDPIEVAALSKVYRQSTDKKQFCAIGSVKTNIGHADVASGVAGFIKTMLALKNEAIPPTLHFKEPNPKLDLENTPFYVNTELQSWKRQRKPRLAGVSSFGIGGTNAHVVLQGPPRPTPSSKSRPQAIVLLSAKSEKALTQMTQNLYDYVKNNRLNKEDFADLAYTLQVGRKDLSYRKAIICSNYHSLLENLNASKDSLGNVLDEQGQHPGVVFMFSGQGTHYVGMAEYLYQYEPFFRRHIDECLAYIYNGELKSQLLTIIKNKSNQAEQVHSLLQRASVLQPCMFIIEYALAKTLMSWSIKPDALIGHSLGEYVAACIAGVFSLQSALRMVQLRGKLTERLSTGKMLAVPMSEDEVTPYLTKDLSIAAINSPRQTVVSGLGAAVDALRLQLDVQLPEGLRCIELQTHYAFHSAMVQEITEEFTRVIRDIPFYRPGIPIVSNLTGAWMQRSEVSRAEYWSEHMRNTVLFSAGIKTLFASHYNLFIEIGFGSTLSALVQQHAHNVQQVKVIYTQLNANAYQVNPHWQLKVFSEAVAQCWLHGVKVDWDKYYQYEFRRRIALPTYPFDKQLHWFTRSAKPIVMGNQFSELVSRTQWQLSPLSFKANVLQQECLLFCSANKLGEGFKEALARRLDEVTVVYGSKHYRRLDSNTVRLNPQGPADFMKLMTGMVGRNNSPLCVVYAWPLDAENKVKLMQQLDIDVIEQQLMGLIYLVQAIVNSTDERKVEIVILANHLNTILTDDKVKIEKAILTTFSACVQQEHSNISVRVIDIGAQPNKLRGSQFYQRVVDDVLHGQAEHVAYRNGLRLTRDYQTVREKKIVTKILKSKGVYLITGGLGKIGLRLAQWLADNYQAHLLLVGHKSMPLQKDWESILQNEDCDSVMHQLLTSLLAIQHSASSLTVAVADVTDKKCMQSVLRQYIKQHTLVDGFFHLAGKTGTSSLGFLKDLTLDKIILQAKPKAQGAKVLAMLAARWQPQFVCLFSSVASVVGGVGYAAYGSANAMLDSMASDLGRSEKTRWLSLSWDAWQLPEDVEQLDPALAEVAILPDKALNLIVSALNSDAAHLVIANESISIKTQREHERSHCSLTNSKKPLLVTTHEASVREQQVMQIFAECLQTEGINLDSDFYALGGNSLLAVRLSVLLEKRFNVKVSLVDLVAHKTVADIACLIDRKDQPTENRALITLKATGDQPPLFLVHPVMGSTFCFLPLVEYLPDDLPCYAIQDIGLQNPKIKFASLAEMAAHYVKLIQEVQPEGPYYLGGYSFGGTVAVEMAQQLIRAGHEVANIYLFDAWAMFSKELRTKERFTKTMLAHQKNLKENLNFDPKRLNIWLEQLWSRMQLIFSYNPPKITSNVILFKARRLLPEYEEIADPLNHWRSYVDGSLRVIKIDADHETILNDMAAQSVGHALAAMLEKGVLTG